MNLKRWHILLLVLAIIGIMDAGYLTFEHYQNVIPPCSVNPIFGDCGKVLRSPYSMIMGIPLALIGLVHYSILTITLVCAVLQNNRLARRFAILLTTVGFISSLTFIYLQLIVIHAICIFCMISAGTSTLLLFATQLAFPHERKILFIRSFAIVYHYVLKPFFFRIDAEIMHEHMTKFGQTLGGNSIAKVVATYTLLYENPALTQEIAGITFLNPIGLAAGFDYEARLTQILPSIGFGFETVGTITHHPYEGNPRPRLGRLPNSQSLMVNKGFKNLGARKTIRELSYRNFAIPIGVSIGRTNSKNIMTQSQSIQDIIEAFTCFEKSSVSHSYYELNISCPNLYGTIAFFPPKNLRELLTEVDKLHLTRPLFIKMPIEKNNDETMNMLDVIAKHSPLGVIFGNLQKKRNHPTLDPYEVKQFPVGNFSGKPTFDRSNELISLSYTHFKDRFIIIGCGGVFSSYDAYEKITRGASLVQLITGMIFKGPQLIADINIGLIDLLKKDGFTHISEAVGIFCHSRERPLRLSEVSGNPSLRS